MAQPHSFLDARGCHLGLLAVLVLVSLGGSLVGEFVWDDRPLIVDNPHVKHPSRIPELMSSSFWDTGDSHDRFRSFFRPLVSLSYATDFALWGLSPFGFHLTNLLLHFLCCALVYQIALGERLAPRGAASAAALFAVHPVHVESVAWISGRTDLLCALFGLAAFAAHRRARDSRIMEALALVAFLAALFAKEMAATLPALVFLSSWLDRPAGGSRLARAIRNAVPFVLVLGVYLAVRSTVLGPSTTLVQLEPLAWLATAIFVVARYLTLLLLPFGLDAHYPYGPWPALSGLAVLVALIMIGSALIGLWHLHRRSPRGAFWMGWILLGLSPVLLFGRFGDVVMADRFLYFPSVGAALLFGLGLSWLAASADRRSRPAAWTMALLLVVAFAGLTSSRTRVWRDDLTLFSDMLRTSPTSALVRYNFGLALYERGDFDGAIEQFRTAIEIAPTYAMAHNNLAAALERRGALVAAERHYRTAVRLAPEFIEGERNLAHLLVRLGQSQEGLFRLERLLSENPRSPDVLYAAADTAYRLGRRDQAVEYLERARRVDPTHAESHYLLGKIRFEGGQRAEAAALMRRFLELWPEQEGANAEAARRVVAGRSEGGVQSPVRAR